MSARDPLGLFRLRRPAAPLRPSDPYETEVSISTPEQPTASETPKPKNGRAIMLRLIARLQKKAKTGAPFVGREGEVVHAALELMAQKIKESK